MNDGKNTLEFLKGRAGKLVFILGLVGVVLIYLSSMLPKGKKPQSTAVAETSEAYCEELEDKITSLVKGITGSKRVSVAITLDAGKQYVYADEAKNSQNGSGGTSEQNYIIIRSENGDESGLLVTEYQPTVRGVAIVCSRLSAAWREDILSAVCAALDISERKIYVTQYAQ